MPITKSIVELMNGHIEVESKKGVGTTFVVTVTLAQANRSADDQAGRRARRRRHPARVGLRRGRPRERAHHVLPPRARGGTGPSRELLGRHERGRRGRARVLRPNRPQVRAINSADQEAELAGHGFAKLAGGRIEEVALASIRPDGTTDSYYSPVSEAHFNCFAEGMLSMSGFLKGLSRKARNNIAGFVRGRVKGAQLDRVPCRQ